MLWLFSLCHIPIKTIFNCLRCLLWGGTHQEFSSRNFYHLWLNDISRFGLHLENRYDKITSSNCLIGKCLFKPFITDIYEQVYPLPLAQTTWRFTLLQSCRNNESCSFWLFICYV